MVILVLYIVYLSMLSLYSLAYLYPPIFHHNASLSCNPRNGFHSSKSCTYIIFQWYLVDVGHLLWSNILLQSHRHIDKILSFFIHSSTCPKNQRSFGNFQILIMWTIVDMLEQLLFSSHISPFYFCIHITVVYNIF